MTQVRITGPPRSRPAGSAADYSRPEVLEGISLFANITDLDLEWLAESVIERRFARGTVIIEEGLPGDHM